MSGSVRRKENASVAVGRGVGLYGSTEGFRSASPGAKLRGDGTGGGGIDRGFLEGILKKQRVVVMDTGRARGAAC